MSKPQNLRTVVESFQLKILELENRPYSHWIYLGLFFVFFLASFWLAHPMLKTPTIGISFLSAIRFLQIFEKRK